MPFLWQSVPIWTMRFNCSRLNSTWIEDCFSYHVSDLRISGWSWQHQIQVPRHPMGRGKTFLITKISVQSRSFWNKNPLFLNGYSVDHVSQRLFWLDNLESKNMSDGHFRQRILFKRSFDQKMGFVSAELSSIFLVSQTLFISLHLCLWVCVFIYLSLSLGT